MTRKRKKCPHGKRRDECVECGGSGVCVHRRLRKDCVECGGSGICEHKRHRRYCKECEGSQVCIHKRIRAQCKECIGSQVCTHGRIKLFCWLCDPTGYAKHLLRCAASEAKTQVHAPIDATPEQIVALRQNANSCALCCKPLAWDFQKPPSLHHNHETGKVIGFVHGKCNAIEGRGKSEEAQHFREKTYVDPDTSDVIIGGVFANGVLRGKSAK